jgi:hypothetical protein
MAIATYIVLLILSNGIPAGAVSADFGTFANNLQLEDSATCEEFASHEQRDVYIRKAYDIPQLATIEVHCLSTSDYSNWLGSIRNYSNPRNSTKKNLNSKNKLSDPVGFEEHSSAKIVEFTGKLITKEMQGDLDKAFYLEINKGRELLVFPSEKVNYQTMLKYRNKRVNLKLQYILQLAPLDVDLEANPPVSRRFYKVIELNPILE